MNNNFPVHPKGKEARILLAGVFGPYGLDDNYGSRKILPMELYHNQITRVQGPFSFRMFHRTFGHYLIQENLEAPCAVLDFPTLEGFIEELKKHPYDIVGIGAVPTNILKVKEMCRLIRIHLPEAVILIGGHVANIENIENIADADHFVKGDGIEWMRKYLGLDENAPIKHPAIESAFKVRTMGFDILKKPGEVAAVLIPSAGCPVGCEFCATSSMFGGKGNFINFYETGDQLFSVMCDIEEKLKVNDFFVMDENFLMHKKRSLRLLELMEENQKSWSLFVFSSANVIKSYTIEQLIGLGISWVWLGLEEENSPYPKLQGIDTKAMVKELQSHGILFVGSTMIGMKNHTTENIDKLIDWAVDHDTDFHQFMLYHSIPGTPLYQQHKKEGILLPEELLPYSDLHGQERFNYRHPHIEPGRETEFLIRAFNRDYEVNGPSIARTVRTILKGWQKHNNHENPRIRRRYRWFGRYLPTVYAGCIWAMRKWFKNDPHIFKKLNTILEDIYKEFGLLSKTIAPLIGTIVHISCKKEAKRLAAGKSFEPHTFFVTNKYF